jgi:site-specific recombinase XerD
MNRITSQKTRKTNFFSSLLASSTQKNIDTLRHARHAFGVRAFQSNVPPHLVQRWLGHASLRTTGIYGDVIGPEECAFAARMWN